jgi:hypothetical protein
MIRLKLNQLVLDGDRYLHNGCPFSGVSFSVGEEREARGLVLQDGVVTGAYSPVCGSGGSEYSQLDVTGLLVDEANTRHPMSFGNGIYSGIGYEFQDGHCIHEMLFDNGRVRCDSWWSKSGLLIGLNRSDHFEEHYQWSAIGQIKSATIACPSFSIMVNFLDDGRLQSLTAEGDVISRLDELSGCDYFPVKNFEDFGRLKGGSNVYLSRNAVSASLFDLMTASGVFDETVSLTLNDTAVTITAVQSIAKLKALKRVLIQSKDTRASDLALELGKIRSDMVVEFKQSRIY